MNVAPRYLGRGSWLARRDPRVLILVVAPVHLHRPPGLGRPDRRCSLLLSPGLLPVGRRSRSSQIRRNWIVVLVFISILVLCNTIIASGDVGDLAHGRSPRSLLHPDHRHARLGRVDRLRARPSWSALPDDGVDRLPGRVLRRPERLRARVRPPRRPREVRVRRRPDVPLPAVARGRLPDDRRRAAHPRLRPGQAGPRAGRARLRRSGSGRRAADVNAIAGAEDTIDAMDLRAFGTGKRTWLRELVYDHIDKLILLTSVSTPRDRSRR